MGCDISRFSVCYWRTKPGRKRLSSGDSDFRHNPDWVEFVGKSDTREGNTNSGHQGRLVSLKKMFSRRKSKPSEPTLPGFSAPSAPSSSEESVETAVRSRNVDLLLKLIHQSGDGFVLLPATGVSKKSNPVELACSLGYYDMVEVLLENGCSPNLPTSAGKLLHSVLDSLKSHEESIQSGRRVVNILINNGCDLDIKDRSGITPLMHCAQIGDGNIMQAVLNRCSSKQLTFQCSGSYTPLHMSSMRSDLACVKLLLSRSPHTHVNLKDKHCNTALHLALKSMLHNIPYLNSARESLVSCGNENSGQTAATCERLMRFQQNSVAIVEALLMAGAEVHVACWPSTNAGPQENFYPLVYALHLCALDHTQGFELDHNQFSPTINLVSRQTIQSLEGLGKAVSHPQAPVSEEHYRFSPYAGVVRLLVLAGTQVSDVMREILYRRFEILQLLLDEVCSFWDKYQVTKPPKLVHLSKLSVRSHLADIHRLHEINRLPVPPRIKEYLKLNCL
ncbi:ankyrin-2-like [Littorina saxatilis]|uniref:SOCS box domain-containing protein n=1 Tax=Littorina saxatilis TaxID=31220 RepID=A0AAN9BY04_9CAEN